MPIKAKAAVFHGPHEPMTIEELDLADPHADEVLIKVLATGLCHTDLLVIEGRQPQAVPAVLGHESTGIVMAVGAGVGDLTPGDHVIPFMIPECGTCPNCLSGLTNVCLKMSERAGGDFTRFSKGGVPVHTFVGLGTFADHLVVKADRVARIRPDARPAGACYASCGGATGLGSVKHAGVDGVSSVAVFGLGGIGLNVVQGARNAGAGIIIGIDPNPAKEPIGRAMGMTHFINPAISGNVTAAIKSVAAMGVTHSFECVGSQAVIKQAIEATNPFYGRCTLIGITPAGTELVTPAQGLSMGRTVGGLLMGGVKAKSDLPQIIDDYAGNRINFDDMISHRIGLEQINEGFDLMRCGESIRTIIMFD